MLRYGAMALLQSARTRSYCTAGKRIGLIHAMRGSVGPTMLAFEKVWPEANLQNIVDDSLSVDVGITGLDDAMDDRFMNLAEYARACQVDGVLFTCSAFGTSIERVQVVAWSIAPS
jgi:hypothetical protein